MSNKPNAQVEPDDLTNPKLNVSCLDFLLIELVPLAQRITDQLHARERALIEDFKKSKIFNSKDEDINAAKLTSSSSGRNHRESGAPTVTVTDTTDGNSSIASTGGADAVGRSSSNTGGGPPSSISDTTREAIFWRLDGLGYRVGQGLAERFSSGKPRPTTPLEAIKFICKDLWILLFRKQIDNLKTNHRGVFVLTDAKFQPLSRMSVDRRAGPKASEEALRQAQSYLYFPCGVIRGALQGLGVDVTITAETSEIPTATFQIKTKGAKA
ncbi:Hypothetical predicted protein [Lecanosticta acicola]|uniref:Transport protein particle component n=1 Tax=Lecanosticta acicola TaxID=111012 RepID=A0AAI8YW45_9PEZI|nr:Hypothetical predicted protein [Lecanosticta acicola]